MITRIWGLKQNKLQVNAYGHAWFYLHWLRRVVKNRKPAKYMSHPGIKTDTPFQAGALDRHADSWRAMFNLNSYTLLAYE